MREVVVGMQDSNTDEKGVSAMDETCGEHHLLGNGYRLDLVSVLGMVVLRREDGSEVTRFSVRDATSKAIEQAAEADYRAQQKLLAGL
jgi:hypothetical protein